jgi:hypothetical protein
LHGRGCKTVDHRITRQPPANLPSGITEKVYRFAEGVAHGLSAADTYRAAFHTQNMLPKTVRDEASRLLKNLGVTATLEALRAEKIYRQRLVSAEIRRSRLGTPVGLIDGVDTPPRIKVRALTLAAAIAVMMGGIVHNVTASSARQLEQQLLDRLSNYSVVSGLAG